MDDYISIIIPVYNAEKYLEQCLNSVLCQVYTNYEVILVDDGSTDNSRAIYRKFADADKRFIVYCQQNQGVSAARNKGLNVARGEIIIFLDSDDVIAPSFLEFIVQILNDGNDIVCFSSKKFTNKVDFKESSNILIQEFPAEKLIENLLYHRQQLSITRSAFRKKKYLDLRFDEKLYICEDIIMLLEVLVVYKAVIPYIKTELYGYRIHRESLTHDGNWRKKLTGYRAMDIMERILINHGIHMERALINRQMNMMRLIYKSIPWNEKEERNKVWNKVKEYRKTVICDTHSQNRERLAALISLCGQRIYKLFLLLVEIVK